jgi:hypothetical protein
MNGRLRALFPALAALALAAVAAPAASADAIQDPIPIGPNTFFTATVNGASSQAVVKVVCPGPASPGQVGHPVSGQQVEAQAVVPPTWSVTGYTGSAANSIVASFSPPSTSYSGAIVLTSFFAPAKIPVTLLLPCYGSGSVTFTPRPTSSTARSYSVSVVFVNIAV